MTSDVQKDIEITREMGLRACSCGRCCNAQKLKLHYDDAFKLSGQVTYLERLVQEYEKVIHPDYQEKIKKFIFSEDDR